MLSSHRAPSPKHPKLQHPAKDFLWIGLWFIACISSVPVVASMDAEDEKGVEFFEKNVRPILVEHCYECHSGREKNGGLLIDSRERLLAGGDSGGVIVPGDPEHSLLVEAIRYKNLDLQMPPKKPLAPEQVQTLVEWIAMGAPDPRKAESAEGAPAPTGMSIEEGRQFWSMQPISNPVVPSVENAAWVQTPIDAFILDKLVKHGMTPAVPADKRTLIRRVTFDLIGIPPTPREIDDFLADDSPDAFRKVVDRLLDSPHYGIRWGRHWLDVARYADSNGLDENLAFGTAWRYRDYVVESFNEDKPFNQFLVEQIAGDLIPNATRETKTATGFLVLGAKVLAEPDREKLLMDTIDEQLDTVGKAFLGMTVGCARCHDHKFDPLKQTDYYALAAIFKSTKTFGDTNFGAIKHWNEHTFADAEEVAKIKEVEAAIAEKQKLATNYKNEAMVKLRDQTRAKATEYLIAASAITPMSTLVDAAEVAKPLELHPRVLHHCRLHLEYHLDDPFFAKWHELAAAHDTAAIDQHYRPLFTQAPVAWADAKQKDANITALPDPNLEAARMAMNDESGFLALPAKPGFAFDEATLAEYNRLSEEARVLESFAPDLTSCLGVTDGPIQSTLPIHIRGSHRNLGEPVARSFPQVMHAGSGDIILPRTQSGRLELAQWMASSTNPLTARVYVNRIWTWHFGRGIVNSPDNFGKLGDRPSHPELLDWLARYFIEAGWSTKDLHRLILGSSTYQMSASNALELSDSNPDPENRLHWKFNSHRLDAEQIRDSILFVSGRLDETLNGKSVPLRNRQFVFDHTSIDHTKYDSLRRAIYLPVIRNNVYTLFEQFDFPDPTMVTGVRNTTTVAPQALFMINSDLVMNCADQLAERLADVSSDPSTRVQYLYQTTLGRPATDSELQRALEFMSELTQISDAAGQGTADHVTADHVTADHVTADQQSTDSKSKRSWSIFCQTLLASNEFMYVR